MSIAGYVDASVGYEATLFEDAEDLPFEKSEFLSQQLITYIGNKRGLGRHLERAFTAARQRLDGRRMSTLDLFAGTGYVSRLLKRHSESIFANDLEAYSAVANRCFLTNESDAPLTEVRRVVERLNREADAGASVPGFIRQLYSPADDQDIQPGERVFYTNDNARRLDFFAQEIQHLDEPVRSLVLGPLLCMASKHANTSGVFKGFYKDKNTGIGKFGAAAGDALKRILEPIRLEVPVLSAHDAHSTVLQSDANAAVRQLPDIDLAYIDPPYNQHPYGSNYFMLNFLVDYCPPTDFSRVSGIPTNWNRSDYNVRKKSLTLMQDLFENVPARFVVVSFNAEGYISTEDLRSAMDPLGRVDEVVVPYNTFRGSRNLRDRSIHVNEHLFLLDRES